jgi:hypothetical protein
VALVFCAVVALGFGAACEVWAYADTQQTEKAKPKAMTKNDFIASSKLLKPEINGNNVPPHLKSGHCVIRTDARTAGITAFPLAAHTEEQAPPRGSLGAGKPSCRAVGAACRCPACNAIWGRTLAPHRPIEKTQQFCQAEPSGVFLLDTAPDNHQTNGPAAAVAAPSLHPMVRVGLPPFWMHNAYVALEARGQRTPAITTP